MSEIHGPSTKENVRQRQTSRRPFSTLVVKLTAGINSIPAGEVQRESDNFVLSN
jgi:hypothetical protein